MIQNPQALINDFRQAASRPGLQVEHEYQPAPHKPHKLPNGKCAVYIFSISASYGRGCPAGAHRVVKVGKAGPNSNARFQSHHYDPHRARSTLAATLLKSRTLWPYLGIVELKDTEVEHWIKKNTDRDNFYLDATHKDLLDELEKYLRGKSGSVFEGG
jgi:thioesterase domain-containing protein